MAVCCLSHSDFISYRLCGLSYVQSFRAASNPCHGCSGCAIHDRLKKKQKLEGRKKPACFK